MMRRLIKAEKAADLENGRRESIDHADRMHQRIQRVHKIADTLDFIAEGADSMIDCGNRDMPGRAANGFVEVLRWAAEEVRKLEKAPPA
jgi:hypothetical protein